MPHRGHGCAMATSSMSGPDLSQLSGRRGALPPAPLGRARAGDRGDRAVPGREGGGRPADRQRLLLRLRARRSRSLPRTSRRSRRGCARSSREDQPFEYGETTRDEARERFESGGREVQAALPLADPRGRQGHHLSQRPVPRPVPRPAPRRAPARSTRSSSLTSRAPTGSAASATRCSSASTAPRSPSQEDLEQHLKNVEEALKRDHRRLGPRARPLLDARRSGRGADPLASDGSAWCAT